MVPEGEEQVLVSEGGVQVLVPKVQEQVPIPEKFDNFLVPEVPILEAEDQVLVRRFELAEPCRVLRLLEKKRKVKTKEKTIITHCAPTPPPLNTSTAFYFHNLLIFFYCVQQITLK